LRKGSLAFRHPAEEPVGSHHSLLRQPETRLGVAAGPRDHRQDPLATSIFPDRKAGAYLLPLKAEIRKSEKIRAGDTVRFVLEVTP
jgi:hypothetical protein